MIPAGRVGRDLLEDVEHLVERLQDLQGLEPVATRVVSDLVVVDEVHVDAPGAAQHLPADERHVQVAQHAVAHRPEEGEGPRPMHSGYDVPPPLLTGLETLAQGLGRRTCEAAREPVGSQHEPGDRLARLPRAPPELDPAHGQHVGCRIAREQVGDGHAVVGQQSESVAGSLLDDQGVRRPVGHEDAAELAVVPPEGGDAGEGAVQNALLAGRRRARQLHSPLLEAVGAGVHPAAQRRHRPGLQCPLGHRERHPVELDEDHSVDLRVRNLEHAFGRSCAEWR